MKRILGDCFYEIQNQNNNIFNGIGHPTIIDLLDQMLALRKALENRGYIIATKSLISPSDADAFFFIDSPQESSSLFQYAISSGKPIFVYLWESPLIDDRRNSLFKYHQISHFFSTSYLPISPSRYTYHPYTVSMRNTSDISCQRPISFSLISGNKYSHLDSELYSSRRAIVKWFSLYYPQDLHVYGSKWECITESYLKYRCMSLLYQRLPRLKKLMPGNSIYRGFVDDKFSILTRSLFNFCLENSFNTCGYVSEKLLHSLQAGSIPIYKGYSRFYDLVPRSLVIDYSSFDSLRSLYSYCNHFLHHRTNYMNELTEFLSSSSFSRFLHSSFISTVVPVIISA